MLLLRSIYAHVRGTVLAQGKGTDSLHLARGRGHVVEYFESLQAIQRVRREDYLMVGACECR
jgi:hypothetical protein